MGEDTKPTLQEIAAMTYPHSERALQRWYGVEPYRERSGQTKSYRVEIRYSWSGSATASYDVEAGSAAEAERLAEELFDEDPEITADGGNIDIDDIFADEVLQ